MLHCINIEFAAITSRQYWSPTMRPLSNAAVLGLVPVPAMPLSRLFRGRRSTAGGAHEWTHLADGHRFVCERMATEAEIASIRRELGQMKPKPTGRSASKS